MELQARAIQAMAAATEEGFSVTGTKVPVVVSYKFKANEALAKSADSNIRFYPHEHGDKGGANICIDFPFANPQFRWDNIKFKYRHFYQLLV